MSSSICIVIAFIAYLALMLYVGFASNQKGSGNSAGDFFLGGRKASPLVTAMSAEASDMSSWLLMGLPGVAYITGLSDAFWTALGLAIGTYLNWLFVSKRLRRYTLKLEAITVPEFFSKRYHDDKNILSFVAAIVIIVFFVPYTASGFKAIGTLFNSLFGMEYHTAMILGALVVAAYTVMGGFTAVSTTDLIQSIVMTIALVVIVFYGVSYAGGWGAVAANANSMTGYISLTSIYDFTSGTTSGYGLLTIISTMAWGLGYFGMPHIILRFMAIRNEDELPLSRRIGTIWVVIAMGVAILIGIIGNAVSKAGVITTFTTGSDAETVLIAIADVIAQNGVLFALLAGLILAGILACTMSTADSQLLAASSSFSQNILVDFLHIKLTNKQTVLAARATVVAIAVIGMGFAWNPASSVFKIVSFAWAGFGATFGPLVLLALFWKRSNKAGALAGMIAGMIAVFAWKFGVRPMGGAWNMYELLPAFIVNFVVHVGVSLATKAPEADIVAEFDEVAAN